MYVDRKREQEKLSRSFSSINNTVVMFVHHIFKEQNKDRFYLQRAEIAENCRNVENMKKLLLSYL